MKVSEIKKWEIQDGWYVNPDTGYGVKLGYGLKLGHGVEIGNRVVIGDRVEIGNWVMLSNGAKIGNEVEIGDWVAIGNGAKIGNEVKIGNRVTLGNRVEIGDRAEIGDCVTLSNGVRFGDGVTSAQLNDYFRELYARTPSHIFTKWVTPGRMSPNFDGGTPIKYEVGAVIEEPKAQISDQQCSVGLHVLRYGFRPEWAGLCGANHNLIPLDVEVASEDICFAGLPTMDIKIRVRKLKVLT